VPPLQAGEEAENTSDVDLYQPLLGTSAGSNCLLDMPLPNSWCQEGHPDVSAGEELTSARIAVEGMVVAFG